MLELGKISTLHFIKSSIPTVLVAGISHYAPFEGADMVRLTCWGAILNCWAPINPHSFLLLCSVQFFDVGRFPGFI